MEVGGHEGFKVDKPILELIDAWLQQLKVAASLTENVIQSRSPSRQFRIDLLRKLGQNVCDLLVDTEVVVCEFSLQTDKIASWTDLFRSQSGQPRRSAELCDDS